MKFARFVLFSLLLIFSSASFGQSFLNQLSEKTGLIFDNIPKPILLSGAAISGAIGIRCLMKGAGNSFKKASNTLLIHPAPQSQFPADRAERSLFNLQRWKEWDKNAKFNFGCAAGCFALSVYLLKKA